MPSNFAKQRSKTCWKLSACSRTISLASSESVWPIHCLKVTSKLFDHIDADKNNELIVAELDGEIVGTLQLTLTPSISFQGSKRATVESVRVDEKYRGKGFGREMTLWAFRASKTGRLRLDAAYDEHGSRRRPPLL